MAPTIGVIGLGLMGGNMSAKLIEEGYSVVGFDVDDGALGDFEAGGGTPMESPASVAAEVDVVITSLPDPPIVREVFLGDEGLLAADPADLIAIEMSTIDPETTLDLDDALAGSGIHLLSTPVSGGPDAARDGTLTVMAGGDEAVIEREAAQAVLETLGGKVYRTGAIDSGDTIKLLNNTMSMGNLLLAMEAVSLGAERGVDGEIMLEVLTNAGASSNQLEKRLPRVLNRNFDVDFTPAFAKKDIGLALDTAEAMDRPMFVAPIVHAMYTRASAERGNDEDVAAVVKLYEAAQDRIVEADEPVDESFGGY
ncbi:MAG: NAD(P)-dependent oxidoreductase [Salinirussus sp.]